MVHIEASVTDKEGTINAAEACRRQIRLSRTSFRTSEVVLFFQFHYGDAGAAFIVFA